MDKTYISTQKYLIMSPRKIRLIAGIVKKMKPLVALERLPFIQRRAGDVLSKVIKSAVANAKNQGVPDTDLVFKEIQIGYPEKFKQGLSLILESEDRKGRFNIFDVNTRRHETTSFAMLLQNPGMIKKMGYDDLFQIGMIAGKHKENYIFVKHLVASQVFPNGE